MAYTDPERTEYSDGEFGSDISPERGKSRSRRRRETYGGRRWGGVNLSSVPWMDIIMILATVVGIILVAVNFDTVTNSLFIAIASILPIILGILLTVAVIAGIIIYLGSRRRRWRY